MLVYEKKKKRPMAREYDRFANPHGLWVRVGTGTGAGWQIATPEKPAPVTWV